METPRHIVVVGGGPAAHRVSQALADREALVEGGGLRLTVITEEPALPYDRVALSQALTGHTDLTLGDTALWEREEVTLLTGERVTALDPAAKTVTTTEQTLSYDEVVLATGSYAARIGIPGGEHAHVYRTLADIDTLVGETRRLRAQKDEPRAIVIGGGLLGLEAAAGLAELGCATTVIDLAGWPMATQLDPGGGQALSRLIAGKGLTLRCGVSSSHLEITSSPGGPVVSGLVLADGEVIPGELVVMAIGIRPRDDLARDAGLQIGPRGGAVIDAACRTSAEGVWAVGEVACYEERCVGLVAPAYAMAEVVADRLTGGESTFTGFDTATKLKLAGVDVASFGDAFATSPGALEIVYADPARGLYQKVVVSDDTRTLLGGVLVGDASAYATLRPLLGSVLPGDAAAYLSTPGSDVPEAGLPDAATLCSCNNVSVGAVKFAVRGEGSDPCRDLGTLKACTKAGTGCGSCVPLLKKTMEAELTAAGVAVSKALCEHIGLSRAELFETVRLAQLTSFEDVMARVGQGDGCDICKPTIASCLASVHNDYVLGAGLGTLQDTNDRALANMQKDGTYSVVPRIPGGEITPEKLLVIAQVAQEYGLYTKITGGQRIDLFGARLDQLPDIWKRLVDAGFESGHAYGKSLRTVKSCVGSTWCRFGVQDSVGLAIELELRYRGLRAPHKLKMGVSGCGRECAEAQSKDVGVIATETGWNLYVGGNGGSYPAHAKLLLSDIDTATLIRSVDRFLLYYIRTADRLQRTARWLEELPGGLEHVREVIVTDSLGLGAELDAAMAHHVESYRDEWAETLDDPDRLRRFRSFVNAPIQPDGSITHVLQRGQRRPATPAERAGVLADGVEPYVAREPEPVLLASSIRIRDRHKEE